MSQISFENLKKLLTDKGIAFKVITHNPLFTMDDVVRELNIPEQATAKTLLVNVNGTGLFRVVLQGKARLDFRKLASILKVLKTSIHFASKDVIEKTGFTVGAIPPFGGELPTCMDQALLNQNILYCGAGDNDKTFSLRPENIIFLSSALVADITKKQ